MLSVQLQKNGRRKNDYVVVLNNAIDAIEKTGRHTQCSLYSSRSVVKNMSGDYFPQRLRVTKSKESNPNWSLIRPTIYRSTLLEHA